MSYLEGDWDKIGDLLTPEHMRSKLAQAGKKAGVLGASEIKKGIRSGAPGGQTFEPLQALTVWVKGSSKPLIDNSDLLGSITHENPDMNTVWIGVKKGAKGRKGDIANVAAVHEFGCTIKVTDKMRKAFAAKFPGTGIRKDTEYIHIPARPFLRPILNDPAFREQVGEIYLNAIKEAFKGAFRR